MLLDAGAAIGGFTGGLFGADTGLGRRLYFILMQLKSGWKKPLDNATKGSYISTFVEDVVEGRCWSNASYNRAYGCCTIYRWGYSCLVFLTQLEQLLQVLVVKV